jgi:hypothetical protein
MARRRTSSPIVNIGDLILDPHNANRGTTRGRAALERSLRDLGPGRSVLIDRKNVIIAGNKTIEQAKALGIPIRIIPTDGRELVAVQRQDLDLARDARAQELALADNRVAELDLEWDAEQLKALNAAGLDLSALWTPDEIHALIGSTATDAADNAPVMPGPTTIQSGDLFQLGRHRVYPGQRTAVGTVQNDHQPAWPDAFRLFPGPVVYAWHAGLASAVVAHSIEESGFVLRAQIIWVKQHFVLSRGDYHWQHEPCWYAVRKGASSHWQGDRTQATVWAVPNLNIMGGTRQADNAPTGHSTQKPVRLFEIPILNHTTSGEPVYDPFVGSGTAVIAAEKTGRVAFAMDIDPQYVQVTVTRWEQFTGQRARRVGRAIARRRS